MFLLQLSGVPGAGKSTLAKEIVKYIPAVIIDHDAVKTPLLESGVDWGAAGKAAYYVGYSLAEHFLKQGFNVIMDSPCLYDNQLKISMDTAARAHADYKYIECYLNDIAEIDRRLKTRKPMPSQITKVNSEITGEELFKTWIDGMKKPEEGFLVIDTSKNMGSYRSDVLNYLTNSNEERKDQK